MDVTELSQDRILVSSGVHTLCTEIEVWKLVFALRSVVARQRIEQTKYCRGTAQNPSAQQCSQTMCAGPSNDLFVLSLGLPLHGDEQKKMCMCGQKLFKNLQCILHLFRINVIICFKTNVHWWGLLHFTCNDVYLAFIQLRDVSYAGAPFYP